MKKIIPLSVLVCTLLSLSACGKSSPTAGTSSHSSSASSAAPAIVAKTFAWTTADFNGLKLGDFTTGADGENYDSVLQRYGKPAESTDAGSGTDATRNIIYQNADATQSVTLTFTQQADGHYLLSQRQAQGLATASFKWTASLYQTLHLNNTETGAKGTDYAAVLTQAGNPTTIFDITQKGVTTRQAYWVTSDGNQSVTLIFTLQSGGTTYLLSTASDFGL